MAILKSLKLIVTPTVGVGQLRDVADTPRVAHTFQTGSGNWSDCW